MNWRRLAMAVLLVASLSAAGCANRARSHSSARDTTLNDLKTRLVTRAADEFLQEQGEDWGTPTRIEDLGDGSFRLTYETPPDETALLGPRTVRVSIKPQVQFERRM
jgi:hypothetical protein